MTAWQKAIKYVAVALAIALAVSIIGGICGVFAVLSFLFDDNKEVGEMQSYSLSGEITKLEIDISAADFEIISANEFKILSNNKYITVKEKNGCLIISEKERMFKFNSDEYKLELYIPKDTVFDKADITTGAGRMIADELNAQTLILELGAGKVDIGSLTALYDANIDGGAGSFTVNSASVCNLDLDMGVGELNFTGSLKGENDIAFGIGKADITLIGTAEDYCIEVDKGIGKTVIDGKEISNDSVFGTGETQIDMDGGIGEITVRLTRVEPVTPDK